ncbi:MULTISPECIES: DUF2884 family protein [unclassified Tatumella]|uniref:DUF2884 family protein n=1 Tax=unclassified Tatumella TaxID=2649542 RepID=UPI001BAF2B21|nr:MULTISPECIES: DUF2884 family protein [unclassified Tatumella]MBS0855829.1 DUF2884 family protein [Tatumella sp. JGM16]MBS0878261.1 DUF2884 family protein [Tatumella sp. JGM82]MBS0891750.1 DUF2884 family protein [Tatumella sp. JGM94]MBS0894776.1 DUF2884 family protein [Tatumella sp. JGM130]MBS0902975.1 DUF2884 family protein [Tatumella sp. JGM100]
MLRKAIAVGLLLAAAQARADYQCPVTPQDDIAITGQQVEITGSNGQMIITPRGEITFNGQPVRTDNALRQQAISYQNALRNDLPWIDSGARQRLENSRAALDKVIVEKLGADSHVRTRLATLDTQLKEQMNRIIEQRSDGVMFHHQAIDQVRSEGQKLVQSALGGILQDSLNELGSAKTSGDNPLQALMGNLGGLQQSIRSEADKQEKDFQAFGKQVCGKVVALEKQRTSLWQQVSH